MKKEKLPIAAKFPHDGLFRKALENPMVAKEFFDLNLPGFIKDLVDTSTLKLEKESFVEEDLSYSLSDVLFSVELKNKKNSNKDKDQVDASADQDTFTSCPSTKVNQTL